MNPTFWAGFGAGAFTLFILYGTATFAIQAAVRASATDPDRPPIGDLEDEHRRLIDNNGHA